MLRWAAALAVVLVTLDVRGSELVVTPKSGGWMSQRTAELIARDLRRVGVWARAAPNSELAVDGATRLSVAVTPDETSDPTISMRVQVQLQRPKQAPVGLSVEGAAADLEILSGRIVTGVADRLGRPLSADARAFVERREQQFLFHRLMGKGEKGLARGTFKKAALAFERAADLHKPALSYEALQRAIFARTLSRQKSGRAMAEPELAAGALERGRVARRQKRTKEALVGLRSYLKYTSARALHFRVERSMRQPTIFEAGREWLVQDGARYVRIDARTGVVLAEGDATAGLVGFVGAHRLVYRGNTLSRLKEDGSQQWTRVLPFEIDPSQIGRAGGQLALVGDGRVAWADVGLGTLGKVAVGVEALAIGAEGATVLRKLKGRLELALLRPGRDAPSWSVSVKQPRSVRMSRGRVLVIDADGLTVYDSRNGKKRSGPLSLGPGARWLGADGRYGVIASGTRLEVFDILGGERTASVAGPGRAVAARSTPRGVLIAFSGGDLLSFERDGRLLDRARVSGRPIRLVAGTPEAPGVGVLTPRGVFAFGEPSTRATPRDIDVMLEMAEILSVAGKDDAALSILRELAERSIGRVRECETLRAQILAKKKSGPHAAASRQAMARAKVASDPTQALPWFRWVAADASAR